MTSALCCSQAVWGFHSTMASAAPQKRMVSSVFITLSSPHRATVTQQQQPARHSGPDRQHSAAGDDLSSLRRRAAETSPASTDRNWTGVGPRAKASGPQSQPQPASTGPTKAEVQEKNRNSSGIHDRACFKVFVPRFRPLLDPVVSLRKLLCNCRDF